MTIRYYWWWVVLSTALLLFWPSIIYADSYGIPFRSHGELFLSQLPLLLGHVAAGAVLWYMSRRVQRLGLLDVLLIIAACEGFGLLLLMAAVSPYSRVILLGTILISACCYVAAFVVSRLDKPRLGFVGAALLAIAVVGIAGAALLRPVSEASTREGAGRETSVVESSFYQLELTEFFGHIQAPQTRGGGMDAVDDGVLLVTGDGRFYMAQVSETASDLETRELDLRAPLNREEFVADAPETIVQDYFGVADLLVQRSGETDRIFTSHHYWNRDRQCYVLRVSKTEWSRAEPDAAHEGNVWETVYETDPCIGFDHDTLRVPQLMMSGGRMKLLNESEMLLTVGDHGFDNLIYGPLYGQTPDVSYGKIVRLNVEDGSAETYSSGHRNPQGLFITEDGMVWSTEHGPRGGDELNQIVQGRNYGWPLITYGTDYHMYEYPAPDIPVPAESLYTPVYSWVPSVGISSLIESNSPLFPAWEGDLLIASLRGRTLYRVRVENNRVVLVEPIQIGGRIRDLVEDSLGRLVLWMDIGSFMVLRPVAHDRSGSSLFITYCATCHEVDDDGRHAIGPDLGGVYNAPIGRARNYQYSSAFEGLSGTWNEANLRDLLADPRAFAPGTTMNFDGLQDEEEMELIVNYLSTLND